MFKGGTCCTTPVALKDEGIATPIIVFFGRCGCKYAMSGVGACNAWGTCTALGQMSFCWWLYSGVDTCDAFGNLARMAYIVSGSEFSCSFISAFSCCLSTSNCWNFSFVVLSKEVLEGGSRSIGTGAMHWGYCSTIFWGPNVMTFCHSSMTNGFFGWGGVYPGCGSRLIIFFTSEVVGV